MQKGPFLTNLSPPRVWGRVCYTFLETGGQDKKMLGADFGMAIITGLESWVSTVLEIKQVFIKGTPANNGC